MHKKFAIITQNSYVRPGEVNDVTFTIDKQALQFNSGKKKHG